VAVGKVVRTEHPHIVMTEGLCGGRPAIEGSRISVEFLARYARSGHEPLDIAAMHPHLKLAAIYDAYSYYFDHKADIDREIEENTLEKVLERHNAMMDESGRVHFRGS
jgi:uncharacterized protein (DUF433 family)